MEAGIRKKRREDAGFKGGGRGHEAGNAGVL